MMFDIYPTMICQECGKERKSDFIGKIPCEHCHHTPRFVGKESRPNYVEKIN